MDGEMAKARTAGMNVPYREKSCDILRRIARQMHARAVGYDALADFMVDVPRSIDEIIHEILCRNRID